MARIVDKYNVEIKVISGKVTFWQKLKFLFGFPLKADIAIEINDILEPGMKHQGPLKIDPGTM